MALSPRHRSDPCIAGHAAVRTQRAHRVVADRYARRLCDRYGASSSLRLTWVGHCIGAGQRLDDDRRPGGRLLQFENRHLAGRPATARRRHIHEPVHATVRTDPVADREARPHENRFWQNAGQRPQPAHPSDLEHRFGRTRRHPSCVIPLRVVPVDKPTKRSNFDRPRRLRGCAGGIYAAQDWVTQPGTAPAEQRARVSSCCRTSRGGLSSVRSMTAIHRSGTFGSTAASRRCDMPKTRRPIRCWAQNGETDPR